MGQGGQEARARVGGDEMVSFGLRIHNRLVVFERISRVVSFSNYIYKVWLYQNLKCLIQP